MDGDITTGAGSRSTSSNHESVSDPPSSNSEEMEPGKTASGQAVSAELISGVASAGDKVKRQVAGNWIGKLFKVGRKEERRPLTAKNESGKKGFRSRIRRLFSRKVSGESVPVDVSTIRYEALGKIKQDGCFHEDIDKSKAEELLKEGGNSYLLRSPRDGFPNDVCIVSRKEGDLVKHYGIKVNEEGKYVPFSISVVLGEVGVDLGKPVDDLDDLLSKMTDGFTGVSRKLPQAKLFAQGNLAYKTVERDSIDSEFENKESRTFFLHHSSDSSPNIVCGVSWMDEESEIHHSHIKINEDGKFWVEGMVAEKESEFDAIEDIIDYLSMAFAVEAVPKGGGEGEGVGDEKSAIDLNGARTAAMKTKSFSHVGQARAEQWLDKQKTKTYIFRLSSEESEVCVMSWKKAGGGVEHTPIGLDDDGKLTIFDIKYKTMEKLVADLEFTGFKSLLDQVEE